MLSGVASGRRLPSGRHTIPPDLVVANQRERLFTATAAAVAERGYASLSVRDVTSGAAVSRRTFYQQFQDKHDCVVAAQRWSFELLCAAVAEAGEEARADGGDWPRAVAAGVAAALEFAAEFPDRSRLILASGQTPLEPQLGRDTLDLHRECVRLLQRGYRRFSATSPVRPLAVEAALGAVVSIVGIRLTAGESDALPALGEELTRVALWPYLDADAETRVAEAA